jgi:hypothetical protein
LADDTGQPHSSPSISGTPQRRQYTPK